MTKTSMELQSLVFSGGSIIIDAKDYQDLSRNFSSSTNNHYSRKDI